MIRHNAILVSCLAIVVSTTACTQRPQSTTAVVAPASSIVWPVASDPSKPQSLTLAGDPNAAVLYTVRVRIPAGCRLSPHRHPDLRHVTVISGDFRFGYGETFDEKNMHVLPPGSVFTEPAGQAHYAWAPTTEVIVQATGDGPSATSWVTKAP